MNLHSRFKLTRWADEAVKRLLHPIGRYTPERGYHNLQFVDCDSPRLMVEAADAFAQRVGHAGWTVCYHYGWEHLPFGDTRDPANIVHIVWSRSVPDDVRNRKLSHAVLNLVVFGCPSFGRLCAPNLPQCRGRGNHVTTLRGGPQRRGFAPLIHGVAWTDFDKLLAQGTAEECRVAIALRQGLIEATERFTHVKWMSRAMKRARADLFYTTALLRLKSGSVDEANWREWKQAVALQMDRMNWDAVRMLLSRGTQAFIAVGEWGQALPYLNSLAQLAPDQALVHRNFAVALGLAFQTDKCIAHLEQAAALDPSDPVTLYQLGHAYLVSAHPWAAIPWLVRSVSLAPSPDGYYDLARAYHLVGNSDAAHLAFQKASGKRSDKAFRAWADHPFVLTHPVRPERMTIPPETPAA